VGEGGLVPTVGERIREVREELGWTLERLAEKTRISRGFLSDVETNKTDISSEYLLRVADAMRASLDYLLRGEDTSARSKKPVEIPRELSEAAQQLKLSYVQTLELLEAHQSVIARRSNRSLKRFDVEDWKQLYKAIKRVYG
jgi:transcriptional regulator with XRE-family HTH domain